MRKVLSSLLVMVFALVTLSVPTAAVEQVDGVEKYEGCTNEYEEIKRLQSKTVLELEELGYTRESAQDLVEFDYVEALMERAKEDRNQLLAYGYTEEQVSMLKNMAETGEVKESVLVATSAECDGWFECVEASSASISLEYVWEWSSMPLFTHRDGVALRWQGVNLAGGPLVLRRVTGSSTYCEVDYYYILSGEAEYTRSVTCTPEPDFSAVKAFFDMQTDKFDAETEAWAKGGRLGVTLEKTGTNAINFINVSGKYGHKIATVTTSIDFSFADDNVGLGISVTPALTTEELAGAMYEVHSNGRVYDMSL